jgi:hypothetical protein
VKKRIMLGAIAAAVALVVAGPGSADAGVGPVSFYQSGSALFRSTSGCITTFATVNVSRDTTRPAGAQTMAALELNRFDTCTGGLPLTPFYREDSLVLPDGALAFDNELNTTRLDATVDLLEQTTLELRPVTLHLLWLGNGTVTRTLADDGTTKVVQASRAASVTGTISDPTTSFVTDPSVDGSLFLARTKTWPGAA